MLLSVQKYQHMQELLPLIKIVLLALIITLILSVAAHRFIILNNTKKFLPLYYFALLYTPLQLLILVIVGQHLPIGNPQQHVTEAVCFAFGHGALAILGTIVSRYFYQQNKTAAIPFVANSIAAIFYIMSGLILSGIAL